MSETFKSALRAVRAGWERSDRFQRCIHAVGFSFMAVMVGAVWGVIAAGGLRDHVLYYSLWTLGCLAFSFWNIATTRRLYSHD